jgi:hypothetical protein
MHGPPGYPEPAPSSTSKPVAGLIAGLFEFLDYFNFPRPGRGVNSIKLENTGNPGEGFILREVGTSSKTEGRQNVIRIMATKQRRYPNGYLRYTNSKGEYINPRTGSTGTEAETHIEPSYRGPFRGLPKFWTGK